MNCRDCPLYNWSITPRHRCCNSTWADMNNSKIWEEWAKHAEKVVEYIKEHG